MTSEIDEAAAVEWANEVLTRRVPFTIALDYNLARAALAWKARADHSETIAEKRQAEIERLTRVVMKVKARAEAAEAERDKANAKLRVMDSRMKQVHAALLASMSDEQLATSVKAR